MVDIGSLADCYNLAVNGVFSDYCAQAADYVRMHMTPRTIEIHVPSKEFFGLVVFEVLPFVVLGFQAWPSIRKMYRESRQVGGLETNMATK